MALQIASKLSQILQPPDVNLIFEKSRVYQKSKYRKEKNREKTVESI